MSDDIKLLQRIRHELDAQVEGQLPALQGRLRAARREALVGVERPASHGFRTAALAASVFLVVASSALWFQSSQDSQQDTGPYLQAANSIDQQMLSSGEDIELYQELEFYYWLQQQESAHAG